MTNKRVKDIAEPFNDPRNINVGSIRIIWAQGARPSHPENWVLPGGGRTINYDYAYSYAVRLARLVESGSLK